jgi:adenylate cyclase
MAEQRPNRRLAAILAADVVGYSRMMAADEAGTLAALKAHREKLFNPAVVQHNGRVVKLIGDGTLVEFASVVDAVRCALDIQLAAAAEAPGPSSIRLRIGVNLGDVIIDGDDIYGDGVNVAARLEPLAEPGGICVASIVNESVGSRIEIKFTDAGEVSVKNIDRPIRVWKWHPTAESVRQNRLPGPGEASSLTRASIAVLPFDNMSGDPEQAYFSDGITEDLITDLSKIHGLMVIARNSSFAYKGKSVDIRQVGRELGVGSVLEGSIRRAGNRVRITAQLIDASNGGHLWAERYDRDLTDIFAVQDEVTRKIVDALKLQLSSSDEKRLKDAAPPKNMKSHEAFMRGRELLWSSVKNRSNYDKMCQYFGEAIALESTNGDAHAGLGMAHLFDYQNRWSSDPDASLKKGDELARKGVELAPRSEFAHNCAAIAAALSGDTERAKKHLDEALRINPNFSPAYVGLGASEIFDGHPERAIPYLERGIRLDPAFSHQHLHFLGLAHLFLGNYETAEAIYRQRIAMVPDTDMSRAMLASVLGHLGRAEEARAVFAEIAKYNANYDFNEHMKRLGFGKPESVSPIIDGIRKAGIRI